MLAGVLFIGIEGGLDTGGGRGEDPGETSAGHTGFKAAIPENGVCRIGGRREIGKSDGLVPDAMGVVDAVRLDEGIGEGDRLVERDMRVEGKQAVPYGEGGIDGGVG